MRPGREDRSHDAHRASRAKGWPTRCRTRCAAWQRNEAVERALLYRSGKIVVSRTQKLARIVRAIADQKQYIARVPDPDNRSSAEANLSVLVERRERLCGELIGVSDQHEAAAGPVAHAMLF